MAVYTKTKDVLGYDPNRKPDRFFTLQTFAPLIAGAIADAASVVLYVPGDVIVQRIQLANSPYKNARDAIKQIYQTVGWQGFYVWIQCDVAHIMHCISCMVAII